MKPIRNSISTLRLLAKHDFSVNKKAIFLFIASLFGLCVMMGMFMGMRKAGGGFLEGTVVLALLSMVGCVASSFAFSDMKSKEGRISSFMLPADLWQKFTVRLASMLICLFVVLLAAFYVTDLSRIASYIIFNDKYEPGQAYLHVVNPFDLNFNDKTDGTPVILPYSLSFFIFSGYLLSQSFFFLGSIIWPKLSFIKTMVALWLLQFLFSILLFFVPDGWYFNLKIRLSDWFGGVQIALAILVYVVSYLRFTRTQIHQRFF